MDILPLPLAEVFTAAGAITWAAALAGIVTILKRAVPWIPEHGRGVLYVVMLLAAGLVALAAYDLQPMLSGGTIVSFILTWAAVVTAASGTYEIASKGGRVVQGNTDPSGPDEGPVGGPVSG